MDIDKLIAEMTLEEKASLCSGRGYWHTKKVERLDIDHVQVSDGPHGLRKQEGVNGDNLGTNESIKAVCFPTAVGMASSFNRNLLRELGETLGDECQAEQISVLLGPGVNIKRSPLCGRNFEYFSEDPYLAGELAASYIDGVQSRGVGTSLKHFAANNQEKRRMVISSVVDERAFREIYLTAFEKAVKMSRPWTVMCSYNQINGTYASENKKLLTDILRNEWGFKGMVVSDWGAVNDRVKGIRAGLDLEMPSSGGVNDQKIVDAVRAGELAESEVDACAKRVLSCVERYFDNKKKRAIFDRTLHHKYARMFAEESMVLLKNNGILPLHKEKKVAFIGAFAKKPRYQGSGSSRINSFKVVGAADAAKDYENVTYAQGYRTDKDEVDRKLTEEAIETAVRADAAVIFAGLPDSFESEGFDRTSLDIPDCQNRLIEEICKVQKNVVVVLHNGAPVTMPWLDKAGAVLESYLGGEGVGEAQVRILFGDCNPSGKLAETFPLSLEDVPCNRYFPGGEKTVEYRESIYVGYRYYDKAEKDVLFPFGYGLSYTQFEYANLSCSGTEKEKGKDITVTCSVRNKGKYEGAEAVQLYIRPQNSRVWKADKELKGFDKVFLKRREEKEVKFVLDDRAFAHYDVQAKDWRIEGGTYEILIGASSRDIRLCCTVDVQGDELSAEEVPACYQNADVLNVSDRDFEKLLGFAIPKSKRDRSLPITQYDTIRDAEDTKWGRRIISLIYKFTASGSSIGDGEMMAGATCETPLNRFINMTNGKVTQDVVDSLVHVLNGENAAKNMAHIISRAPSIAYNVFKKK